MRTGLAALALLVIVGCDRDRVAAGDFLAALDGASPERGRAAAERYDCGACHRIPGVPDARGRVGPNLDGFRRRVYVGGAHPNTPDVLVRWIQDAPSLSSRTAMPDVGVDVRDARDIAAYLYTLE
jgi:cytochrome c2